MTTTTDTTAARKAVDAARKGVARAKAGKGKATLAEAEQRLADAQATLAQAKAEQPAEQPAPLTPERRADLAEQAAREVAEVAVPTLDQLAEAREVDAEQQAAKAAARPAREPAKPKNPASTVGSTEWKQLREAIVAAGSEGGKLTTDAKRRGKAIKLALDARRAGVAWSALSTITRLPEVRGLNKLVWDAAVEQGVVKQQPKK